MDLREKIRKTGRKQKYFCEILGLNEAHFSQMLSGLRPMPELVKKEIERICSA